MSAFNEAWVFLKAYTDNEGRFWEIGPPTELNYLYDVGDYKTPAGKSRLEEITVAGGGVPFDELLSHYTNNYPYFTHPENITYKNLMQYLQQLENQKTPLRAIQDEERRFLVRGAAENADILRYEEGKL